MGERRCSKIAVMQLFHELKQKFPALPDHVVSRCIAQSKHDRKICEASLQHAAEQLSRATRDVTIRSAQSRDSPKIEMSRRQDQKPPISQKLLDEPPGNAGRQSSIPSSVESIAHLEKSSFERMSSVSDDNAENFFLRSERNKNKAKINGKELPKARPANSRLPEPCSPQQQQQPRSSTSVSLTLRSPSSEAQPPIHTSSWNPAAGGFQSRLQVKIARGRGTGNATASPIRAPPGRRPTSLLVLANNRQGKPITSSSTKTKPEDNQERLTRLQRSASLTFPTLPPQNPLSEKKSASFDNPVSTPLEDLPEIGRPKPCEWPSAPITQPLSIDVGENEEPEGKPQLGIVLGSSAAMQPLAIDVDEVEEQPGDKPQLGIVLGSTAAMQPLAIDVDEVEEQPDDKPQLGIVLGSSAAMQPLAIDVDVELEEPDGKPQLGIVLGSSAALQPLSIDVDEVEEQLDEKPQLGIVLGSSAALEPLAIDVDDIQEQSDDKPQLGIVVGSSAAMQPLAVDVDEEPAPQEPPVVEEDLLLEPALVIATDDTPQPGCSETLRTVTETLPSSRMPSVSRGAIPRVQPDASTGAIPRVPLDVRADLSETTMEDPMEESQMNIPEGESDEEEQPYEISAQMPDELIEIFNQVDENCDRDIVKEQLIGLHQLAQIVEIAEEREKKLREEIEDKKKEKLSSQEKIIRQLRSEIYQLQLECERMAEEVDRCTDHKVPLGEIREEFYSNIYTGQPYNPPVEAETAGTSGSATEIAAAATAAVDPDRTSNVSDDQQEADGPPWVCSRCTFRNHYLMQNCEECDLPRNDQLGKTPDICIRVTHHNFSPRRTVHNWAV